MCDACRYVMTAEQVRNGLDMLGECGYEHANFTSGFESEDTLYHEDGRSISDVSEAYSGDTNLYNMFDSD